MMGKKLTLLVDGKEITKTEIKEKYNEYNKTYFNGELGKCDFYWMPTNQGDYGKYNAQPMKDGKIKSSIGVARNVHWTEENLRELLVHEMIHMYIRTVEGKTLDGVLGHGRRFKAHCKRLKKDFNLNITIHGDNFKHTKKELSPKLWEKVLLWLIDR